MRRGAGMVIPIRIPVRYRLAPKLKVEPSSDWFPWAPWVGWLCGMVLYLTNKFHKYFLLQ